MNWQALRTTLIVVSLTAGGYELTQLIGVSFCDIFKGTPLGIFCDDECAAKDSDSTGGGCSGAQ